MISTDMIHEWQTIYGMQDQQRWSSLSSDFSSLHSIDRDARHTPSHVHIISAFHRSYLIMSFIWFLRACEGGRYDWWNADNLWSIEYDLISAMLQCRYGMIYGVHFIHHLWSSLSSDFFSAPLRATRSLLPHHTYIRHDLRYNLRYGRHLLLLVPLCVGGGGGG